MGLQVHPQGMKDNYALSLCPEYGCKQYFQTESEFEQHLLTEKHTIPP